MIRIFETGDIHIGKKYDDYPDVKAELIGTRFNVLKNMIETAEKEHCDFFVITGDLFDTVYGISQKDVERVVNILSLCSERVLILPGNHDYFDEETKIWKDFVKFMVKKDNNIILLNRFEPYEFEVREEKVVFYPAYCQSKKSKDNNLTWIKNTDINPDCINVGVAHGAIEGVTPDKDQAYFLMKQTELDGIPVDAWLIGHTHIPFPEVMRDQKEHKGYKIFNAGTHAQTDVHNNTEGFGFVIEIDHKDSGKTVTAKAIKTGEIRFYDLDLSLKADSDTALNDSVRTATNNLDNSSMVRLNLSGTVTQKEYTERSEIYDKYLKRFLFYKIDDNDLSEAITIEKIRDEYAETSFAAMFLEALSKNPKEMAMAYELVKECKE